ncbi:NAD(P)-binding protein [Uliginosibacterium sp. 31-16]|uniref:NAD(P)-binding protein n=1 Tax=Uliginosibacterium sp. 31-16 TaxID=3068315 RepID=UPI00273F4A77|nr:NAD(P)/FAD-dependent oxidoreductase [Uliginosibacterium sp. 31-16]MDP5238958.1 NAD(P)-binding protein [Uliginosibacterium sp. 31-16]
MKRRDFLKLAAATSLAGCSERLPWQAPPVSVHMPGMELGHRLRDRLPTPNPTRQRSVDVAILGSGVAGLFAGWRLAQAGYRDFCLLGGPEPLGNTAGSVLGGVPCPTGAHYLPLPSMESTHVREMLAEFGVLHGDPFALRPEYAERALVHAPDERLFINAAWQDGIVPQHGLGADDQAQIRRFFGEIARLREARGQDGRRAFVIPLALSSADPVFTALATETFVAWLNRQGFTAPPLRWYADYCCRDDYGAGIEQVSAWAGLHYFASRGGHAANAEDGAVLTWPDGLQPLAQGLRSRIGAARWIDGMALQVSEHKQGVDVLCFDAARNEAFTLHAKRVIVAMPLHVAAHAVANLADFGFDKARDLPASASWLVSNFLLNRFPQEADPHQPLAWDNVVYGGEGLGWVVATHQWIRQARPAQTVFTAYRALDHLPPQALRAWLVNAPPAELLALASSDLHAAYGNGFARQVQQVAITVRGHAMATPAPGFLARPGIAALCAADRRILFAHADLSGLSVFEEAAWWGEKAAGKILT